MSRPKAILSDTVLVGNWPEEDCDRCEEKGVEIIHWGPLALKNKDRTTNGFCLRCWQKKSAEYRNRPVL